MVTSWFWGVTKTTQGKVDWKTHMTGRNEQKEDIHEREGKGEMYWEMSVSESDCEECTNNEMAATQRPREVVCRQRCIGRHKWDCEWLYLTSHIAVNSGQIVEL